MVDFIKFFKVWVEVVQENYGFLIAVNF